MRQTRMMTAIALALACMAAVVPRAAEAQDYSVFDVGKRTQLSLNAGGTVLYEEQTGAEGWKGATAGGTLTYSLHKLFAVHGTYDHGFPIDATRGHVNMLSAFGNLRVLPKLGETSDTHLFVGGGILDFDQGSTPNWQGYEGHLIANHQFKDGWGVFLKYTHGESFDDGVAPLNILKFGGQRKLFGWKPPR